MGRISIIDRIQDRFYDWKFFRHKYKTSIFERDFVMIDFGRYEYFVSVNMEPTLILRDKAQAVIDKDADAVVWFGCEAHDSIERFETEDSCRAIWPFEKPLEIRTKYMKQAMFLLLKRIPLQNRFRKPVIAVLKTGKFDDYEYRQILWTLRKIGYSRANFAWLDAESRVQYLGEKEV